MYKCLCPSIARHTITLETHADIMLFSTKTGTQKVTGKGNLADRPTSKTTAHKAISTSSVFTVNRALSNAFNKHLITRLLIFSVKLVSRILQITC